MLRQLPNLISCLRIALVAPLVALLLQGDFEAALWIAVAAGLSDALDGFLARHFNWRSRLGSLLDPAADKLMLVAAFLTLARVGQVAWALAWLVLARDVVIVLGAFAYHRIVGRFESQPSLWSKANTLGQILFVLLVLASNAFAFHWQQHAYAWIVAALTVISGMDYIVRWGLRGRNALRARTSSR
ncbi:MAG TPA: CDP-alcohol phosphatidyltransferase family protein [Rhodanobacteraceae bacterium]|jgi:cardiolipin synthase|nr:CDP-alcohol phosphatidyltransferase family protein [Rhodanobacteraceae bacterium]